VILGDNVYEDDFAEEFKIFEKSSDINSVVFIKEVKDPTRFGVVQFSDPAEAEEIKIEHIVEKPKRPPSPWAVTGLYLYDENAFEIIRTLEPSGRGELEITDLNNWYLENKKMVPAYVTGFWSDAGTFQSMLDSSNWAQQNNGKIKE
jgi:glucose-1-phosphate thymidylyltransferase